MWEKPQRRNEHPSPPLPKPLAKYIPKIFWDVFGKLVFELSEFLSSSALCG
jgi:hypothetical protein